MMYHPLQNDPSLPLPTQINSVCTPLQEMDGEEEEDEEDDKNATKKKKKNGGIKSIAAVGSRHLPNASWTITYLLSFSLEG